MRQLTPLIPALQSNWLMMHVTVMLLSYATLLSGSLLAISFLILDKVNLINTLSWQTLKTKSSNFELGFFQESQDLENSNNDFLLIFKKIEFLKILDNLSYRLIGIGFSFLTIGILSGAVWANEAWGSYWSWDPKETWALITWIVFAIYLHTRLIKGWKGKKSALVASLGFFTLWVCYLGVNILGKGLHSYGWFL